MSAELKAIEVKSLVAAAIITATGNRTGFDLRPYDGEIKLTLDSAAGTGTTPTLDAKIQHSDDNTTFVDSGVTFTQVTTAASYQVLTKTAEQFKRYIRVVDTVTGTTPSFARAVSLVAKKR